MTSWLSRDAHLASALSIMRSVRRQHTLGNAMPVTRRDPQSDGISACHFIARDWDLSLPAAEPGARARAGCVADQAAAAARGHAK